MSALRACCCGLGGVACALLVAAAAPSLAAEAKWADPAKTIRVMFPIAETGFDPQATNDYYSSLVEVAIFETLYSFDYLARPYRFVPDVYGKPMVVAGFEPLDILASVHMLLQQIREGRCEVENQYTRVVRPEGSTRIS